LAGGACIGDNGCISQDIADEHSGSINSSRAANLPEDIASLGTVFNENLSRWSSNEGRPELKDKERIGVTLSVERERPGKEAGGRKVVHSRDQRQAAKISGQCLCYR
jgi:hypothetical protein